MAHDFEVANYPTTEPASVIAGDRWAWKRTDLGVEYPPTGYDLKYNMRHEARGLELEITAAISGTTYLVVRSSAVTIATTPGRWLWTAHIVRKSDSERITVGSGVMVVAPNLDTMTGDLRSHARKVLDAINAVLEGTATREQASYQINGRAVSMRSPADLLVLRDRYLAEVRHEEDVERMASGLPTGRRLGVRFNRV